jgi:hypothetical protein
VKKKRVIIGPGRNNIAVVNGGERGREGGGGEGGGEGREGGGGGNKNNITSNKNISHSFITLTLVKEDHMGGYDERCLKYLKKCFGKYKSPQFIEGEYMYIYIYIFIICFCFGLFS